MINHVDSYTLGEQFQSAYKRFHSTETALLRVKNDILRSLDKSKDVLMVLLDMSAAFDTVDHDILLQRLHTQFGISSTVNTVPPYHQSFDKRRFLKTSYLYLFHTSGTPIPLARSFVNMVSHFMNTLMIFSSMLSLTLSLKVIVSVYSAIYHHVCLPSTNGWLKTCFG